MSQILILIRDYNDADHIIPLACALGAAKKPVWVLSVNPQMNMEHDVRFNILKKTPTISSGDALHVYPQTIAGWLVSRLIAFIRPRHSIRTTKAGLLARIYQRLIWAHDRICDDHWAESMLRKLAPDAIVLEWGNYNKSKLGEIVRAAHHLAIPMIAVPHGLNVMSNKFQSWQSAEEKTVLPYGKQLVNIDWVVSQHRHWSDYMIAGGVNPKKILIMGSARFCPEWHNVLKQAYHNHSFRSGVSEDRRLKVVYMDHGRFWRVRGDVVEESLRKIACLDFIDLVIKPSTRTNMFSNPTISQLSENVSDVPSPVLVEWADVVICAASSILVEALLQKKPLIYPKHHHENTGIIEKYGACWQVSDDDALINALKNLSSNAGELPYDEDTVDMFLNHLICGDQSNRDILKDHVEFIQAVAERGAPALEKIVDCFGVPAMNQESLNA